MSIKSRLSLLNDRSDPERMDLLMRTIKAVHSATTSETFASVEELNRQRAEIEHFSKLLANISPVKTRAFNVGDVKCEWVSSTSPHRTDKVILYCHGGGYTCGGLGYARILASKLAYQTCMDVISFEYRLAPEHPYPAAIEDAVLVWDYLMHKGYGAKDIIVAGDSAGGNLTLELCISLRENERILPAALVLFSPWTDMRAVASSYKNYADKDPLLTYNYVLSVRNAYAGNDADFESPKLSPLLADLSNYPPTLIQVGSNEILRGDSEHLAKNMTKAGSYAKLEVYPGGWHVFQQMPLPKANTAIENVATFINTIIR